MSQFEAEQRGANWTLNGNLVQRIQGYIENHNLSLLSISTFTYYDLSRFTARFTGQLYSPNYPKDSPRTVPDHWP